MLSNDQKSLLKRAQRQADLPDSEYREALRLIAGVNSSTDPGIGDRHLDRLMAYFEAIYWRKIENEKHPDPDCLVRNGCKRQWLPFLARGYWANKNTKQETSRERFVAGNMADDIVRLESELHSLGYNMAYVVRIRLNVMQGRGTPRDMRNYKAVLERTINSKRKKLENVPF
jgi:hypothetical protein